LTSEPNRVLRIAGLSLDGIAMMAPLAGVTDSPMRRTVKKMGASLVFTEMVSATGLLKSPGEARSFHFHLLSAHPEERPLAVQLFGAEPELMARAARLLAETDADMINVNMGCPVPKVVRRGEGVALMKDPERVRLMLAEMRKAIAGVPLTVKLRSGFAPELINAPEICRIAEGEGADAVIVHGRSGKQGYAGRADRAVIRDCVKAVKIPVIANGDLKTPADVASVMSETGCAGAMIARGALGNPWIFRAIKNPGAPRPDMRERKEMILWHFSMIDQVYDQYDAGACMRKFLVWYSKGIPGGIELRRELSGIKSKAAALEAVDKFFSHEESHPAGQGDGGLREGILI